MAKITLSNLHNRRKLASMALARISRTMYDSKQSILQAVSAAFGIDEGNDDARIARTRIEILPLIQLADTSKFEEICKVLPNYKAWTASGAHRFMPLGMAVKNILAGRNVFSMELIASMPEDVRKYMMEEHPLYGNPMGLPDRYRPSYFPELTLSIPQKDSYSWLDIGSAPKENGAPTLNILKEMLPPNFSISGCDIAMPRYRISDNAIINSNYVNHDGSFKDSVDVNGIRYLNATVPEHDVASADFLRNETFDFISICMTLHHFYPESSPGTRTAFTSFPIIDSKGNPFADNALMQGSHVQTFVVDDLLKHLAPGGILFLDAHPMKTSVIDKESVVNENLYDMFFVLQRIDNGIFQIHANTPILFNPNRSKYDPSGIYQFIRGWNMPMPAFTHRGISSYININKEQEQILTKLFARADALAARYQSWKKGIYGKAHLVLDGIRSEKSIHCLFSDYLSDVPDSEAVDSVLKRELLEDVSKFEAEFK